MNLAQIEIEIKAGTDSFQKLISREDFLSSKDSTLIQAAALLLKNKRWPEREALIKLLETRLATESLITLLYIKGDLLVDKGSFEKAAGCYTRIIQKSETDIAYNNRGFCRWSLKNYRDALSDYLKAVEINPKNHTALRGAGEMYMKLELIDDSISLLKRAVKNKSNYEDAWISLGTAFSLKDEAVRSYKCFLRAVEINPNSRARKGIESIEKMYDVK